MRFRAMAAGAGLLLCWRVGGAAPAPWPVAAQPDLKAQLERAPVLAPETLGSPARSVTAYSPVTVPNPDGKSWDVLQWYYKDYGGPTWLYAIDLGTGQVKKQRFPDKRQIHIAGQKLAPDGKYYIVTPSWAAGGGMELYVYDPATNTLSERGVIVPDLVGERRDIVVGPDGKLYGTGNYQKGDQAGAYSYDLKTGKVRNYGPVGPSHSPNSAWGYTVGVDDTHIYVASGKIPWYLVAVEIASGAQKVLLQAPPGDRSITIQDRFPGAVARVQEQMGGPYREYWLHHGEALPKMGDTPPWQAKPSLLPKAPPEPETYSGEMTPDAQGRATFWWRSRPPVPRPGAAAGSPEAQGWQAVRLEGIETYPLKIHRLTPLPDGRIFGRADGYLGAFLLDPTSGKTEFLGDGGGSPYTFIVHEGTLYWSGYPSGPIYAYNPVRPWTLGRGGPPGQEPPPEASPQSNPRRLGEVFPQTRVKKMFHAAVGADGRVYFGGEGQRDYNGGGLGWVDPRTGALGGLWKPFTGHSIHWVAPALDASLLVLSTKAQEDETKENRVSDQAKLFVFDVAKQQVVRQLVPVPGASKTGPLLEVAPGRLLGTTEDPAVPGGGLLYGLDVRSGEVLFRKPLPATMKFPWSQGTAQWDFRKGPDGFLWTYLGNTLVRIEPKDARVEVIGQLNPTGKIVFAGRDIYLAGTDQLRRLRGVVP